MPHDTILFTGDSAYHRITVTESNGTRLLAFGANGQEHETAYNYLHPDEPLFEYPGLMATGLALKADTKTILLIGLGGGYLPGVLRRNRPDIAVTVVEIDPLVVELAERFFDFTSTNQQTVVVAEARAFLSTTVAQYDQIWIDAFDGAYIPAPLMTVEFLQLCQQRLTPHGVIVQNVHYDHPLYMAQLATFTEVFGYYYAVRGVKDNNAALIAQQGIPKPHSIKTAFAKGLKQHGYKLGEINLRAELTKAILSAYRDNWAILRDVDTE